MTNSKKGFAALLGVMLVTALACDPYAEANKADPTVVRVLAIWPAGGGAYPPAPMEVSAPTSGTTWNLPGVCGARANALRETTACTPYGFRTTRGRQVIAITFNQQLEGADVQTTPGSCTPASTLAITSTVAPTGTQAFRACYQPGGIEGEGGTILVFIGSSNTVNRPDQGLALAPAATYTVASTGSGLRDQNGKYVQFTVNVTTVPGEGAWLNPSLSPPALPGSADAVCFYDYPSTTYTLACKTPGAPWYTGVTATSVTVNWAPITGATVTGWFVERAPDIGGIPGTFTSVLVDAVGNPIPVPATPTNYTDNTVVANTIYWYRVTAIDGNLSSPGGDSSSVTTPLSGPAAPTFTNVGFAFLTVNWTAVSTETGYYVEQADNVFGVNGGFAPLNGTALPLTPTSYTATGLSPGTAYWFRVDTANATGISAGAPALAPATATVPTPTFTNVTATTLTVNWTAVAGAATYNVQRAPNVAGVPPAPDTPGTWATIATGVAATTFADTGLTTATKYWYRIVTVSTAPAATATGSSASVTTL